MGTRTKLMDERTTVRLACRRGGPVAWCAAVVAVALLLEGCSLFGPRREPSAQPATVATRPPASIEGGKPPAVIGAREAASPALAKPEFYRGAGFQLAAAPVDTTVIDDGDGSVTLNFVNTDIREVIDAILGDILKQPYVIDPRVAGTVTVRTSRPLNPADMVPVLEDILTMNGAAIVKSTDMFRIVPLDQATGGFRLQPGFGIHVIPLRFAAAAAVQSAIESFVPPGRTLHIDSARNMVLFTGTQAEATDLEALVQVFDVDWMAGMSFAIFPLKFAEAKRLTQELEQVFGQNFDHPLSDIVQFMPIDRLNAILVITPEAIYLDRAATWIERLDRGEEGIAQRIYVYLVQNGRAKDLAAVLDEVFSGGAAQGAVSEPSSVAPGLTPSEMTRYPSDSSNPNKTLQTGPKIPPHDGAGNQAPVAETSVVAPTPRADTFDYAASDIAQTGIAVGPEAGIRITADERNNALLVRATPQQYRMIEATLKQLDIVPLQVLIEATIAEVTLNDQLKYGLQWFFENGDFTFSLSDAAALVPSAVVPGFNMLFSSRDARVILSALTSITDVQVISSPQLMVLDNESARLQVGDQVPIATQSAVSVADPEAPIVNSIEYRDTGVILDIIPHVNASGLVVLDIIQEVSSVVETETSGIDSPTIQQRQIESSVAVQTGETIALGGLIRDGKTNRVSGIPILSDIPILGNLFKTTDNKTQRTELLVLLTPRVIRNNQDSREVTNELRQRLPSLKPLEMSIYRPQATPAPQSQKPTVLTQ